MNKKIIAIVGATASGKSSLAMALAERHNGEIISCDSMQVYRRMNIGTAKPTAEEQAAVRHHMIDIVEPNIDFSCADYVAGADAAVRDCLSRGKLPIVCGGTGLYLDALLRNADPAPDTTDPAVRQEWQEFYLREGKEALFRRLEEVDPESALAIHPNNVKRVIRALEVYQVCGVRKSELDRRSREGGMRFPATVIGLWYEERELLYRQIDVRVDKMLCDGLLEETRSLIREGVFETNRTAAQAIGYKELMGYLAGRESLTEATEALKSATRHYAKRQMTWFGAKDYVRRLPADDGKNKKTFEEIVNNAEELFSEA